MSRLRPDASGPARPPTYDRKFVLCGSHLGLIRALGTSRFARSYQPGDETGRRPMYGLIRSRAGVCALLLALASAAVAPAAFAGAGSLQWSVMTDAFGTRVDYPAAIFTTEQGSPPRGTGRVLESADGQARLMVYAEENEAHHSPASFVQSNLATPISQIDYRRITDRFFAVSGENDGRIFYSRCNFPDRRNGHLHCIFLSYKSSEKEAWDDIVTRISLSLRPR